MGGKFDFNFKIKIIQTDLAGGNDFYNYNHGGYGHSNNGALNPIMYENSGYISKLFFINNISGGIMAKEKIEDMPERYQRFVSSDIPSDADMLRSIKKELDVLANREEVGQNVFYSNLSSNSAGYIIEPGAGSREKEFDVLLNKLEDFLGSAEFDGEDIDDLEDFDDLDDFDEYGEGYGSYENEDEIRDILHLNHYYNSEEYKMSKVKYDFSSVGNISLANDNTLDIIYDESEMTGFKDSYARFLFNAGEKNIVTMCRRSFMEIWLTLEKGKRISVEHTDRYSGSDFVFTAETKELVNNMTAEGGNMRLVYVTETNGVPSEMITHIIEAERAGG